MAVIRDVSADYVPLWTSSGRDRMRINLRRTGIAGDSKWLSRGPSWCSWSRRWRKRMFCCSYWRGVRRSSTTKQGDDQKNVKPRSTHLIEDPKVVTRLGALDGEGIDEDDAADGGGPWWTNLNCCAGCSGATKSVRRWRPLGPAAAALCGLVTV